MNYCKMITAYTALATTHQMLSNASLENILKLYGLLCIFSLPIGLVILISLYRKHPDTIKEMSDRIDRLVDGKDNKEGEKSEKSPKNNRQDYVTRKPKEEENMEFGIANLVLSVGDRYQCFLSKTNRENIRGGVYTWSTDNSFVGRIHEYKGVFEAKKVGTTYIEYGAEHIRIYFARIEPSDKTWFGYQPVMDILRRDNTDNVKCREVKRKISTLDDEKGILSYKTPEGILTYEFDRTKCMKRVLLKFDGNNKTTEGIIRNMREYFERVTIQGLPSDHCYWYHKCGYDDECGYPESVDFVAFMRPSKDGKMYFGIGENWRIGAGVSEISNNLEMIDRSFSNLLDGNDIPTTLGMALTRETNDNNDETGTERNEPVPAEERKERTEETSTRQPVSAVSEKHGDEPTDNGTGTTEPKNSTAEETVKDIPNINDLPDTEEGNREENDIYDEEGGVDEAMMEGSGFEGYETDESNINPNE